MTSYYVIKAAIRRSTFWLSGCYYFNLSV